MAEPTYEVVWPLGESASDTVRLAPGKSDLNGKTVCELWDWLFNGDKVFPIIREALSQRYPDVNFIGYDAFGNTHGPEERRVVAGLPDLLRQHGCDAVISAVGA